MWAPGTGSSALTASPSLSAYVKCTLCMDVPSDTHTAVHKTYHTRDTCGHIVGYFICSFYAHLFTLLSQLLRWHTDLFPQFCMCLTGCSQSLLHTAHPTFTRGLLHMYTMTHKYKHLQRLVGACTQRAYTQRLGVSRAPCGAGECSHSKLRSQERASAPGGHGGHGFLRGSPWQIVCTL